MIRHVFSVICRYASVDQFSNTLTMAEVVENLSAQSAELLQISNPPVGLPIEASVVSAWFNDGDRDEETKQRISLVVPNGRVLTPHETSITVKAGQSHRTIAKTPALPYCGDGRYWFEVSILRHDGWDVVARLPFVIQVAVRAAASANQ